MATRTSVPKPDIAPGEASVVDALADRPSTAALRLINVAPHTLILKGNIRTDPRLDTELLESIRDDGVLEPVTVEEHDGTYTVVDGQRRVLAAMDAGLDTIPAIVKTPAAEAPDGIAEQLKRNELRQSLTEADRAAALQQMSLFGLTADQIVRKTKTKREKVDAAVSLIGHNTTNELLAGGLQLDLVHAAALAEFEDLPDTYRNLVVELERSPERAEHIIESYRSERERATLRLAKIAELEAEGIQIIDDVSSGQWLADYDVKLNGRSYPSDADIRAALTKAGHLDKLGAVVSVQRNWNDEAEFVVSTSFRVRRDVVDLGIGFTLAAGASRKGPKSEAEKEQARKDRADKKLWEDATAVRRRYLTGLLAAATPPKAWETIVASAIAGVFDLNHYKTGSLARELLDIQISFNGYRKVGTTSVFYSEAEMWLERHPNRARHLALGYAVAAAEVALSVVDANTKPWRRSKPDAGPYLAWLKETGYKPAAIEQDIIDADAKRIKKLAESIAKKSAKKAAETEDDDPPLGFDEVPEDVELEIDESVQEAQP